MEAQMSCKAFRLASRAQREKMTQQNRDNSTSNTHVIRDINSIIIKCRGGPADGQLA